MPDDTTGGDSQQGGQDPQNQSVNGGAGTTDDDDGDFDPDRAKATIKAQRESEKKLQRQISQLNAKLKEREDADLSEVEKLKKDLSDLQEEREGWQRERRQHLAEKTVIAEADKLKAKSPVRVFKIISADLEYDDEGKPTNVASLLKAARDEFPELFLSQNGSADGGAGNGRAPSGSDMTAQIRAQLGRT